MTHKNRYVERDNPNPNHKVFSKKFLLYILTVSLLNTFFMFYMNIIVLLIISVVHGYNFVARRSAHDYSFESLAHCFNEPHVIGLLFHIMFNWNRRHIDQDKFGTGRVFHKFLVQAACLVHFLKLSLVMYIHYSSP